MKGINPVAVLRSAQRLMEAYNKYWINEGPDWWIWFMRRESGILLRRSFWLWLKLRFGRVK